MLSNSLSYTTRAPWLVLYPGLAISLTVLSVFLLADGLRDAMDPGCDSSGACSPGQAHYRDHGATREPPWRLPPIMSRRRSLLRPDPSFWYRTSKWKFSFSSAMKR